MEAATATAFASGPVAAALRLADRPETLLDQQPALGDDCQRAVKQLFDLAKQLEPKTFTPSASKYADCMPLMTTYMTRSSLNAHANVCCVLFCSVRGSWL